MSQPYKVCPNCGQRAVPSMTACGRCGRPYRSPSPPSVPSARNPLQTTALVLVSIASALFIAIWIAVYRHNLDVARQTQEYQDCLRRRFPGATGSFAGAMQNMMQPQNGATPSNPGEALDAINGCVKPQ